MTVPGTCSPARHVVKVIDALDLEGNVSARLDERQVAARVVDAWQFDDSVVLAIHQYLEVLSTRSSTTLSHKSRKRRRGLQSLACSRPDPRSDDGPRLPWRCRSRRTSCSRNNR